MPKISKEQREQALKNLDNRYWRLNNLYWIRDVNGVKVKFKLNWAQKIFYSTMHWLCVILKVRQLGMSTFMAIFQLDLCLFQDNQVCGIIDITENDAKKKLAKCRFAYDHLDDKDDPETAWIGANIKSKKQLSKGDSATLLGFSNGSQIWAGVSFRGDTCNFLHISELGMIAFRNPLKASEIAAGSINTVHPGNWVVIESTHEGGRSGLNYEMIRLAQASGPNPGIMDWKMFFFDWMRHPEYTIKTDTPIEFSLPLQRHFDKIERDTGITLTIGQKNWYAKKKAIPDIDMARQFPATIEEALTAETPGSIYGEIISVLREQGRICPLTMDGKAPLLTFWDLGDYDFTCIWLLQFVGRDILALDYWSCQGELPSGIYGQMLRWQEHYKRPIKMHFLPHDSKQQHAGTNWIKQFNDVGMMNITPVPRTPTLWDGINDLKAILPRFYFDSVNCEKEFRKESAAMSMGAEQEAKRKLLPSGLSCLESYHSKQEGADGRLNLVPVHDKASHGASALRTAGESYARGLIDKAMEPAKPFSGGKQAKTGISEPHTLNGSRGRSGHKAKMH